MLMILIASLRHFDAQYRFYYSLVIDNAFLVSCLLPMHIQYQYRVY
jgi:hypothetical protein